MVRFEFRREKSKHFHSILRPVAEVRLHGKITIKEIFYVDSIMGEITSIEDELKGLAIETDLAAQESAVDIESLPADVRAEIEKESEE